jgi:hypothetical protein
MQYILPIFGLVAGALAWSNETIAWTTVTTDIYTTYCPSSTTFTQGTKTYTATASETREYPLGTRNFELHPLTHSSHHHRLSLHLQQASHNLRSHNLSSPCEHHFHDSCNNHASLRHHNRDRQLVYHLLPKPNHGCSRQQDIHRLHCNYLDRDKLPLFVDQDLPRYRHYHHVVQPDDLLPSTNHHHIQLGHLPRDDLGLGYNSNCHLLNHRHHHWYSHRNSCTCFYCSIQRNCHECFSNQDSTKGYQQRSQHRPRPGHWRCSSC